MTSYHAVEDMVAQIRAAIVASASLKITDENGETVSPTILDRDEDPAILAASAEGLPAICVILIGDKADAMHPYISSYDWLHHFNVVITGYYRATDNQTRGEDIYDDIDTLREKAYDCAELFKGSGAWFSPGVIKDVRLELGYYEIVDFVIYRFVVTLSCEIWEV
jgi:hypothetical protein